eukprot:5305641-Prymnesium_polylepis.2
MRVASRPDLPASPCHTPPPLHLPPGPCLADHSEPFLKPHDRRELPLRGGFRARIVDQGGEGWHRGGRGQVGGVEAGAGGLAVKDWHTSPFSIIDYDYVKVVAITTQGAVRLPE